MAEKYTFIVVGGGIAGVSCVENLATLCPEDNILLISSSPIVKSVINLKQLTRNLEQFDVYEKHSSELESQYANVSITQDEVSSFDSFNKVLGTINSKSFRYEKLCICTGASPKVIAKNNEFVIGIRDTETVFEFESRLVKSRRVVIVGNGGIATELVFKIQRCEVLWAIKDNSIISTFIDPGASRFLLPHMLGVGAEEEPFVKRGKFSVEAASKDANTHTSSYGCALGPDWIDLLKAQGRTSKVRCKEDIYCVEVKDILTLNQVRSLGLIQNSIEGSALNDLGEWPVYVRLTNEKLYGCDFVISATGVLPNIKSFENFELGKDGGLLVNERMQTSISDVYAAGDVCTAGWKLSPFWLQMRLWSQARQMGVQASRCMVADWIVFDESEQMDFCFELFAHVTKFFNYKVILLGKFNGQDLNDDYKLLIKVVEGCEKYIKVVLQGGRMVGAILIGETDLEETFENLILNQLDLTRYGDGLLDQDIEDFFD
ncbi:hypothetical protein HELRODRAFT_62725 [Helobdella robusta]|uniref:Pyridine nucleotide-disulfide oxidoreductase domain-containing protein 1 n=1 Tax=Helobdella robusta TaxID=6412 RepID=T1FX41_HELRO|nr:hypothetical protein HELRODRAFT_62725 [Helobdella robusta]ESO12817.1 hypothetical protein HELRODRAFT_62725 [Helobdella robusta]